MARKGALGSEYRELRILYEQRVWTCFGKTWGMADGFTVGLDISEPTIGRLTWKQ